MRLRALVLLGLVLATGCKDTDRDGTRDKLDCRPNDPLVHLDAEEVCDGIDNNCNGQVDEDVAIVAYWDRDGDGYGDDAHVRRVCELPDDGSEVGGDCDDLDPNRSPGTSEVCDLVDNDCNDLVDDGATRTFYEDLDGDGHGTSASTVEACWAPAGYAGTEDDCDDAEPEAWDGRAEICDDIDNDCDGAIDEDIELTRQWADADGDGYGDPNNPVIACGPGPGVADNDWDCNDADPSESPGANEIRGNGVDEDCDDYVDEFGVGPGNEFATIEDALRSAPDGAVVQLDGVTHVESVDLRGRDITLAGEGCDRSILYGDGEGSVVAIDAGRIENIELSGGSGTVLPDDDWLYGGGVLVQGDVTIDRTCVIGNGLYGRGGGIAVASGTLQLTDSVVANNTAVAGGGGIYVGPGALAHLARVRVLGNESTANNGGGVMFSDSDGSTVTNSVFARNVARDRGAGLYVYSDSGTDTLFSTVQVRFSTFHENRFGDPTLVSPDARGSAACAARGHLELSHVLVTGHPTEAWVLADTNTTVNCGTAGCGLFLDHIGFRDNDGTDLDRGEFLLDRIAGDPEYVLVDPAVSDLDLDFRLRPGSAFIDAGNAADPTLNDLDGSPADIGAYGGPEAPADWDLGMGLDTDGDGLPDGWEIWRGTNRWLDDSLDDDDADGLTHADELASGSHPLLADTDADGVDDGTEIAAGDAPTDRRDHGPVADAGTDTFAWLGEPALIDGSASWDPDGTPLTFSWSLVSQPAVSAAALVNATAPVVELTPDASGTYVLELVVDSGGAQHADTIEVRAVGGLIVPDDFADVQSAIDTAATGTAVGIRAGTWLGPLDLGGKDLTLVGLDAADQVVLDGSAAGPVITADEGERLTVARLTLTNGYAEQGGGFFASAAELVELFDVRVVDNDAVDGGGGWALDTPVEAFDTVFAGNEASRDGGALFVQATDKLEPTLRLERATLAGNVAARGGALHLDGSAASNATADYLLHDVSCVDNVAPEGACWWHTGKNGVRAWNVLFAGNQGDTVLFAEGSVTTVLSSIFSENVATYLYGGDAASEIQQLDTIWWNNQVTAEFFPEATSEVSDQVGAAVDPQLPLRTHDGDPTDDVLVRRITSPSHDLGFIDHVDPDASRSDAGSCAGDHAAVACARFYQDSDGDGLTDGWEIAVGLDVTVDDASGDLDGDGLDNQAEHDLGIDPRAADSDEDGLPDATDAEPGWAWSERPIADAGAYQELDAGSVAVLDGSASTDPNGTPLTFSWRLVSKPLGSALTTADLTGAGTATPSFVPDVRGGYRLGLVVSDGTADSLEADVIVRATGRLEVPGTYATIDDALDEAMAGDAIVLGPGTWPLNLDLGTLRLRFIGAGASATVLMPGDLPTKPIFTLGADSHLTLQDLTLSGGIGRSGGAVVCTSGTLIASDVVFRGNVADQGGAMYGDSCQVVLTDTDLIDNRTSDGGGAIYAIGGSFDWTRGLAADNGADGSGAKGGALYLSGGQVLVQNVRFTRNTSTSSGAAIYVTGSSPSLIRLEHLTFGANQGNGGILYRTDEVPLEVRNSLFFDSSAIGFEDRGNGIDLVAEHNGFSRNDQHSSPGSLSSGPDDVIGRPMLVSWDPDADGSTDDLRLLAGSPDIDAGSDLDPDGSPADIGAWGGPNAGPDWDLWQRDTDGDTIADGWELAFGLDPADPSDATLDPDGDGLDTLTEYGLETDPTAADTDGDGVSDGDEVSGGTDPTSSEDFAPVADAEDVPVEVDVGQVAVVTGTGTDPNNDPLTYQWRLVAKPLSSSLTDADLTGATTPTVSLTPDNPGVFALELVVHDGTAASAPDIALVQVRGDVYVPEDYPTVAEGVASTAPGYTLHVGQGTWPTRVDLQGRSIDIRGAGRDLTLLDGEGLDTVLTLAAGETVTLSDLTIQGGFGALGGGVYADGATLFLQDVGVSANQATDGGGMYLDNCTVDGAGVRITDNVAGQSGGGLFTNSGTLVLQHALIAANLAPQHQGGGVHAASGTRLQLTNAVFSDNLANFGGGIYYKSAGDVDLAHVTATFNESTDSGSFLWINSVSTETNAQPVVTDSIVYANRGNDAVYTQGSTSLLGVTYTLFAGNGTNFKASATDEPTDLYYGNLIDNGADPAFLATSDDLDWTNDTWTIDPATSSAHDAGDPQGPLDVDGSTADMGAFGGAGGVWTP